MQNSIQEQYEYQLYAAVSPLCRFLCIILFCVLGILPVIPSAVTQLFRPLFILLCLLWKDEKGAYPLLSNKWRAVSIAIYTVVLLVHPITSNARTTYISIETFILFYIFATSRMWSKKEIYYLLLTVIIACDIHGFVSFISNAGLLHVGSSQHIEFFNYIENRNPVAFALVPGVYSGLFLLFFYKNEKLFKRIIYIGSIVLCAYCVLALGCRSAFYSAVAGGVLIMWEWTKLNNSTDRFFKVLVLVILGFIVLQIVLSVVGDSYSARLFSFGKEGRDTGRSDIWEDAWQLIKQKPVFGGGFDYWVSNHPMGTHNTFLLVLLYAGFIGATVFGLFTLSLLKEVWDVRSAVPLAFLSEVLFHCMSETTFDYYAHIPLILGVVILRFLQFQSLGDIRRLTF